MQQRWQYVMGAAVGITALVVAGLWWRGSQGHEAAAKSSVSPSTPIGTTGGGAKTTQQPVVIPPALPQPPVLRSGNQALRRFVDKQTDAATPRLAGDFLEQVPRIETADEIAAIVYVMEDWTEDHAIRNEAMNLLARSNYEPFTMRLVALIDRPFEQERMRAFFVQHLGTSLLQITDHRQGRIRERLREALRDRHLAVRREAVGALAEARDPLVVAALERGVGTSEWDGMYDLAIYLCHQLDLKQHMAAIRAQATAADQQTRIAALYVLGQWRDQESRPAMEAAAASAVFQVRRAGEMALARLQETPRRSATNKQK